MGSSIEALREQMTFLLEQGLHDSAEMLVCTVNINLLVRYLECCLSVILGLIETVAACVEWQGSILMSLVATNGELSLSCRAESMVMLFLRPFAPICKDAKYML